MTLIDELFDIEHEAYRKSPIHSMDSRVKLILCLLGLLITVVLPYIRIGDQIIAWPQLFALIVIYVLFCGLYLLSGASIRYYLVRLMLITPFGLFFILLQPFFGNPYYDLYHVLFSFPFGITMYWESLIFGLSLFAKFIISLSFIILLSATTTMQDMLEGASRLHVPRLFITVMSLTVRYLFVFALAFKKIQSAFACKCFRWSDHRLPLKYRLNVIGNAAGSLFIRAMDQGERTYISMCCRGYASESAMHFSKKPLAFAEWIFLVVGIVYLLLFPIMVYLIF
ncbi:MAG TPA: cobalt ECF transporter T component CbiQ [Methanocorpusculum sp.]|nr:cobalt ECF transporter T component CbiQ [Methanocorpusculum sp.]